MADFRIRVIVDSTQARSNLTRIRSLLSQTTTTNTRFRNSLRQTGTALTRFRTQLRQGATAITRFRTNSAQATATISRLRTSLNQTSTSITRFRRNIGQAATINTRLRTNLNQSNAAVTRLRGNISQTSAIVATYGLVTAQTAASIGRFRSNTAQAITGVARFRGNLNQTARQITGVGASINRTASAFGRFTNSASQAVRGNANLNTGLQRTRTNAISLRSVFIGLFAGLSFIGITRSVINLSDSFVILQNRLRVVTDSSGELDQVTDRLFQIARLTRSSFTATTELFTRIRLSTRQLGASQDEVLRFTEAVNQAIQLSGSTARETEAVLIQFSQGLASGALRGDELRSVQEQAIVVADTIANSLGATRGELRELGRQGLITSEVIFRAFIEAADELRVRFAELQPTIGQSLLVLRNSLIRYIGEVNDATSLSQRLANTILLLADNFDILANAILAVGAALATIFIVSLTRNFIAAAVAIGTFAAAILRGGATVIRFAAGLAAASNPVSLLTVGLTAGATALITYANRSEDAQDENERLAASFIRLQNSTDIRLSNIIEDVNEGLFNEEIRNTAELQRALEQLNATRLSIRVDAEDIEDIEELINRLRQLVPGAVRERLVGLPGANTDGIDVEETLRGALPTRIGAEIRNEFEDINEQIELLGNSDPAIREVEQNLIRLSDRINRPLRETNNELESVARNLQTLRDAGGVTPEEFQRRLNAINEARANSVNERQLAEDFFTRLRNARVQGSVLQELQGGEPQLFERITALRALRRRAREGENIDLGGNLPGITGIEDSSRAERLEDLLFRRIERNRREGFSSITQTVRQLRERTGRIGETPDEARRRELRDEFERSTGRPISLPSNFAERERRQQEFFERTGRVFRDPLSRGERRNVEGAIDAQIIRERNQAALDRIRSEQISIEREREDLENLRGQLSSTEFENEQTRLNVRERNLSRAGPSGAFAEIQRDFQREADLAQFTGREREIQQRISERNQAFEDRFGRGLNEFERETVENGLRRNQLLNDRTQILTRLRGPQEQLTAQFAALNRLNSEGELTLEEYNRELRDLELQQAQLRIQQGTGTFADGLIVGLDRALNASRNFASQAGQIYADFFGSLTNGFADSIVTAVAHAENFADVLRGVALSAVEELTRALLRLVAQQAAISIFNSLGSRLRSTLGGAFGGRLGTLLGAPSPEQEEDRELQRQNNESIRDLVDLSRRCGCSDTGEVTDSILDLSGGLSLDDVIFNLNEISGGVSQATISDNVEGLNTPLRRINNSVQGVISAIQGQQSGGGIIDTLLNTTIRAGAAYFTGGASEIGRATADIGIPAFSGGGGGGGGLLSFLGGGSGGGGGIDSFLNGGAVRGFASGSTGGAFTSLLNSFGGNLLANTVSGGDNCDCFQPLLEYFERDAANTQEGNNAVSITQNNTINVTSTGNPENNEELASSVARSVTNLTRQTIINEQRPGGLLNRQDSF